MNSRMDLKIWRINSLDFWPASRRSMDVYNLDRVTLGFLEQLDWTRWMLKRINQLISRRTCWATPWNSRQNGQHRMFSSSRQANRCHIFIEFEWFVDFYDSPVVSTDTRTFGKAVINSRRLDLNNRSLNLQLFNSRNESVDSSLYTWVLDLSEFERNVCNHSRTKLFSLRSSGTLCSLLH